jgi:hypothetical protein
MWEVPHVDADTIVILGGGPSLRDTDFSKIQQQVVIGTNNAFELGDWVDYNFFMDVGWWQRNRDAAAGYKGVLITDNPDYQKIITEPFVERVIRYNTYGLDISKRDGIPWNKNSGAGAVNIAAIMGAKRIILLGFDMKPVEGAPNRGNNWHDKHKSPPDPNQYKKFLRYFDVIKTDLDKLNANGHNLQIINCTPDSALRVFPTMRLEDVL